MDHHEMSFKSAFLPKTSLTHRTSKLFLFEVNGQYMSLKIGGIHINLANWAHRGFPIGLQQQKA